MMSLAEGAEQEAQAATVVHGSPRALVQGEPRNGKTSWAELQGWSLYYLGSLGHVSLFEPQVSCK